jgi:hypothetical protein
LIVDKAEVAAKSIQTITEGAGGFVSYSEIYEVSDGIKTGSVTVRVPADKFDQALTDIKKLANKVERENVDAQDVTEQYADLEAQLRNLRATENQYLEIMKKAAKVSDILEVQQRLSDVQGQIEQIQGQMQYLNRQVDMSTINVSLTAQADVQVFGIEWRPLFIAKQALRNLISGLTGYINFIIALIFFLPVLALWLVTLGIVLFLFWKVGKWLKKRFFPKPVQ